MKPLLRLLASCALVATAAAQPFAAPLNYREPVFEKNFPLLAAIEQDREAAAVLLKDPALVGLTRRMAEQRRHALEHCEQDMRCLLDAFRLGEEQIAEAAAALARLADQPSLLRLVTHRLRPQAMLFRHHGRTDAQLIELGWREAAAGLNRLIEVYGEGKPPRYPAIDSPMFDTASETYRRLVFSVIADLEEATPAAALFFESSLRFGLALLEINLRDEAGRFEPLHLGENRAAWTQVARTDFSRYAYSAILVPGAGPDRPNVALSPAGKLRVRIAARRYHAGKAPFLIVSGGFVHPNQTPFCEAIEMKKALINEFGVPEAAIFVDPHARHTTTNLRNAVRILFRYGLPEDRPALVTTDVYQSRYIESPQFAERCLKELGYLPFEKLSRISVFDLEFRPNPESLHVDPQDPLDP